VKCGQADRQGDEHWGYGFHFSFRSLRPGARLGHEAVDEAVERSESWGAPKRSAGPLGGGQPAALRGGRVTAAGRPAASIWVGFFMFIRPYQTGVL
jgi:hypothetical protein